jgi:RecB family exonuclease
MMRPGAVAAEVLARAGQATAAGQEPIRWLILRDLFASQAFSGALRYFAAEALAGGRGYADAFARTIADLEAAGLGPADLERAALALATTESDAKDRLRDVATVWRVLASEEDERRRTRSQLLADATAVLATRPEIGIGLGALAAVITSEPPVVLRRFLAALPGSTRFELAAGEPKISGDPALALYSSVAEEVDGAAAWVVQEIVRGTRLDDIALVVPDAEAYAPQIADRLARLTAIDAGDAGDAGDASDETVARGIPVHVPERERALATPAGRRLLALLHALDRWLDAQAVIPLLPWLRTPEESADDHELRLTPSLALDVVYAAGIVGGREAPGDEWAGRLRRRAATLRTAIADAPPHEHERRRTRRDRRSAELHCAVIDRIQPAMAELEMVAARIRSEGTLAEIWPLVAGFGTRWLKWPPDPPGLLAIAGAFLDPLLAHPAASRLTGSTALHFLIERLQAMRLGPGVAGRPAVTVTTAAGAAGRSFRAVRVLGLAEGIVPRSPREDPILPSSLRRRMALELDCRLPTPEDQVREDRRALDRVAGAPGVRLVMTAPRLWLDRSEREVSGALLEIVARGRAVSGVGSGVGAFPALPSLAQFRAELIAGATPSAAESALARAVLPKGSARPMAIAPGSASGGRLGPLFAPEAIPGLSAARPLSATALSRLLTCPYWFFLERLIGFQEPPERPSIDTIAAAEFGSLVHAIAAEFFTAHGVAFCANQGRIEDWVRSAQLLADRAFERFLDRYPLRGAHAIERERQRTGTVVEQLIRHEWQLGAREFVGAELAFGDPEPVRLDLPAGPLYITGDIDRVDRFQDRGLEVRDLKTGRARDLAEEPMAVEHDLQIGLYATALPFAGVAAGPPWPRVGAAAYVYPVTERDPERRFSGESLARLMAWTGRWLDLGRMLLASGTFVRTPRAGDCRFCPFTAHCGDDAQAESRKLLAAATSPELMAFAAFKTEEHAP